MESKKGKAEVTIKGEVVEFRANTNQLFLTETCSVDASLLFA